MRPTIFKHRCRYGGATSAVVLRRGCDQSKHTFKFHSAEHTRIYGSGLSKTVVAVPVEVAPRARRRRVKGQSTFDRIRQPQIRYLTQISIYFIRSCWREAAQILLYRNSSTSKFYYPIFTRYIDELNLLSAIRALSYFRSSQSLAAKFRTEKDSRRS